MSVASARRLEVPWARVEPRRGDYDEAELARLNLTLRAVAPGDTVVVLHAGCLPDWVIARGGWLDPDAVASFGCYVDRVAQAVGVLVARWATFACFFDEVEAYESEAPRVARVLLDAHATAYLHLRRTQGKGGKSPQVGLIEEWTTSRARERAALLRVLTTGKLHPPFGRFGELPNGSAALDFVGVLGAAMPEGLPVPIVRC